MFRPFRMLGIVSVDSSGGSWVQGWGLGSVFGGSFVRFVLGFGEGGGVRMELRPTWACAFEHGELGMIACLVGVVAYCFVSLLSGVCVFVAMRWVGDGGGEDVVVVCCY